MVRQVGLTTDFESVRSALDAVTVVGDTSLQDVPFPALHTAAPEATRPLLLIGTTLLLSRRWLPECRARLRQIFETLEGLVLLTRS
jgi:hypothetical protein